MTNRLILNLCHSVRNPLANNEASAFDSETRSQVAEIKFATNTVLGNIGAPLQILDESDDDEPEQRLGGRAERVVVCGPEESGMVPQYNSK